MEALKLKFIGELECKMSFGFTNDLNQLTRVQKWRDDAVKDGWSIKGTYEPNESVDRASTLEKDGFKALILTRSEVGKWNYEASVHVWGPDSLSIIPGDIYDFEQLKKGLRVCSNCKKEDVDTFCYSFAGRCCKDCLPELKKTHEYPGWYD